MLAGTIGCGAGDLGPPNDTGLSGLSLAAVNPAEIVPGSTLVVTGSSFVDTGYGTSVLRLRGDLDGQPVDVRLPLRFIDYGRLEHAFAGASAAGFPADEGTFDGEATVEVRSSVDGQTHASPPRATRLQLTRELVPVLDALGGGPVIFVNEPLTVLGGGLLLGGGEGQTLAEVSGCVVPTDTPTCLPVDPVLVPVTPQSTYDRSRGTFPFDPAIAGIRPGQFRGSVRLVNVRAERSTTSERAASAELTLIPPAIFSVSPAAASLGQYVDIRGGGFLGPEKPGEPVTTTTVELVGSFTPVAGPALNVRLDLTPEFVAGPLVRYVLNEDDALGRNLDLRHTSGTFEGTARPVIARGAETVRGDATPVVFDITPVKQVIWLRFQHGYVESLRKFGLRAVDAQIRERVLEVARRDFAGVNIEFRTAPPVDFALYSVVDISGPDLNGLGYFGYDNTPGKDIGNERLYDLIGGLNATTQQDGQPGYGGVFVESLFAFSRHPGSLATMVEGASPLFDDIFDPFRPDLGGAPVLGADVAAGIPGRATGEGCPAAARTRPSKIACAVFVLGSLIGTTMTHEIGHSLGLAAPDGDPFQYHNLGDEPNRLMDGGSSRTFAERAELEGEGPSVFCEGEYAYLRDILPSDEAPPDVERPICD